MHKLLPDSEVLSVCFEAKTWGHGIHRQMTAMGHDCFVVTPSLILRKATDWIKIDRHEALSLVRLHRAGGLTRLWAPDQDQVAMRDLTHARENLKAV